MQQLICMRQNSIWPISSTWRLAVKRLTSHKASNLCCTCCVSQYPKHATEAIAGRSTSCEFVHYKAALAAVLVVLLPPAYTSQMCHACLHLGHRHEKKRFRCTNPLCGWVGDADWN